MILEYGRVMRIFARLTRMIRRTRMIRLTPTFLSCPFIPFWELTVVISKYRRQAFSDDLHRQCQHMVPHGVGHLTHNCALEMTIGRVQQPVGGRQDHFFCQEQTHALTHEVRVRGISSLQFIPSCCATLMRAPTPAIAVIMSFRFGSEVVR